MKKPLSVLRTTLLLSLFFCHSAFCQTEDPQFPITNGTVCATVKNGNTVYLGGSFSFIGPFVPYAACLNITSGTPNMAYERVLSGAINVVVPDGSGGWFIGGSFRQIGSTTRNRIARINADGTLNA